MDTKTVLEKLEMAKSEEILSQIPEDRQEVYMHYLEQEEKEINRLLEATTTSNVDKVVSVFIPAIKKLARDSFIDKLVGVQPIDDRIAVVEFMDCVQFFFCELLSHSSSPFAFFLLIFLVRPIYVHNGTIYPDIWDWLLVNGDNSIRTIQNQPLSL